MINGKNVVFFKYFEQCTKTRTKYKTPTKMGATNSALNSRIIVTLLKLHDVSIISVYLSDQGPESQSFLV